MKALNVKDFFQDKKKDLLLTLVTNPETLKNNIINPFLNRPGLALSGYYERFTYDRIQVLGETEVNYLQTLKDDKLYDRMKEIFSYQIPCFIVTKGLSLPAQVIYLANELEIAILVSRLSTNKLYYELGKYLDDFFAPSKTVHGTLVDIFGVGILVTGKSGIGKSECALDLIDRGQRLVTDDAVKIIVRDDVLMGSSTNDYGHFMEVRGVGLIDVEKLFGIHAVRVQKRIDIQVELMPWKDNMDYERIGLGDNSVEILDIKIPIIYLPVSPGKNVSVVIEVIAMNHILKTYGYDAAKVFTQKLQEDLQEKAKIRNNLIKDKE